MGDAKRVATWSATIEKVFLEELALSANVMRSAIRAGTTDKRAWQRRRVDAKFRAAFLRALAEGYLRLELRMLQRALERAFGGRAAKDGPSVQEERLWLQLLTQHRAAVQATDIFEEMEDLAVVKERIEEKLAEMNRRLATVSAEGSDAPRMPDVPMMPDGASARADPPPTPPLKGRGEEGKPLSFKGRGDEGGTVGAIKW